MVWHCTLNLSTISDTTNYGRTWYPTSFHEQRCNTFWWYTVPKSFHEWQYNQLECDMVPQIFSRSALLRIRVWYAIPNLLSILLCVLLRFTDSYYPPLLSSSCSFYNQQYNKVSCDMVTKHFLKILIWQSISHLWWGIPTLKQLLGA